MPKPAYPLAKAVIQHFEGLALQAYVCPTGVPTIGWGSTRWLNGQPVQLGQTCSRDTAEQLLDRDIAVAAAVVQQAVQVPLHDHQLQALVSFVHNVGAGNFQRSTLLRFVNAGWHDEVPAQLLRWCRGGQRQVLPGLLRRRRTEAHLYATGQVRFEHGNPVFPTLRQGDSGPHVKQLQRALNDRLQRQIPVTGYFGPQTQAALQDYQRLHGFTADGVLTPTVANHLGLWV